MARLALGLAGILAILAGLTLAAMGTSPIPRALADEAAAVVFLVGFGVAAWRVGRGRPTDRDVAVAPWEPGGGIGQGTVEHTPTEHPITAHAFAGVVAQAGAIARTEGTVEEGVAVLRPRLRAALVEALVQGGLDEETAEQRLRTGEWTDNAWAASVVDPNVEAPTWTARQRLRAWLFPEETVRRLAREAVRGVATAADAAVSPVPGQEAPRTVPVSTPSIAALQRGADGRLQDAVEPTAAWRGQETAIDDGTDATPSPATGGSADRTDAGPDDPEVDHQ